MSMQLLVSEEAEALLCGLPEELDERVSNLLRRTLGATGGSCAFLAHLQGDHDFSILLDADNRGVHESRLPTSTLTEWLPQLHFLRPIMVPDTKQERLYSKPTQRFLAQRGLRSLLIIPMASRGFAVGFIGVASRAPRPDWPATLQSELLRLAEALGNVFDREYVERQLGKVVRTRRDDHRRAVELQERERRFLAHELHDQIGQLLTAIKTEAALVTSPRSTPESVNRRVSAIRQHVDSIYVSIHALINRLRSTALDELGLEGALRSCVMESAAVSAGVKVTMDVRGDFADVEDVVKMTVFRVLQECMTNIARHAGASKARVLVIRERAPLEERRSRYRFGDQSTAQSELRQDRIRLLVEDDGAGFDTDVSHSGVGLMGMRERLKAVNGSVKLESKINQGTKVEATINLSVVVEPNLKEGVR